MVNGPMSAAEATTKTQREGESPMVRLSLYRPNSEPFVTPCADPACIPYAEPFILIGKLTRPVVGALESKMMRFWFTPSHWGFWLWETVSALEVFQLGRLTMVSCPFSPEERRT